MNNPGQAAVGLDTDEIPPLPQPQRLSEFRPAATSAESVTSPQLVPAVAVAVARSASVERDKSLKPLETAFETVGPPRDLVDRTWSQFSRIDVDGAEFGWFVGRLPQGDTEFTASTESRTIISPESRSVAGRTMDESLPRNNRRAWHDESVFGDLAGYPVENVFRDTF